MELKILSPLWGHEHIDQNIFLEKIRAAGYDGLESWLPAEPAQKKALFNYLQKHEMLMVAHQHEAFGSDFDEFKRSFLANLYHCAESDPVLINSHTGKDYFTVGQNLQLFDIASEFSEKTGIAVAHETHRGRALYSAGCAEAYFNARKELLITADFSHWVCVSESMLENFQAVMSEAFQRTIHLHARVGYEEGPQVPDPRAPEWAYALDKFLYWWDMVIASQRRAGRPFLTITTEFGPAPYMPLAPYTQQPMADQFELNLFMKQLLKERYNS